MSLACCSSPMCCVSLVNGAIQPTKGSLSPWQTLPYGATLVCESRQTGMPRLAAVPSAPLAAEPELWHLLDLQSWGISDRSSGFFAL